MRTNYFRHLANILWSRPVWGGGGGCKRQKSVVTLRLHKHDAVLEVIDEQAIL